MKRTFRCKFIYAIIVAFVLSLVLSTVAFILAQFLYYTDFYDWVYSDSFASTLLWGCLIWQLARMVFCRAVVTSEKFKVYPNLLRGLIQWPKVYQMSDISFVKGERNRIILELETQNEPVVVRCGFLNVACVRELQKYIEDTMYRNQDARYAPPTDWAKQAQEMEERFRSNRVLDPEILSYNESFTVNAAFIKRSKRFRFWFIMFILAVSGFGVPLLVFTTGYNAGSGIDAFGVIVTLGMGIFALLVGLIAYAIMFRDTSVVPSTVAIRGGRLYLDDDSYAINDIDAIVMTDPEHRSDRVYNGSRGSYRYTRTGVLRHLEIQLTDGTLKKYYFGTVLDKNEQCKNYTEIYETLMRCCTRRRPR